MADHIPLPDKQYSVIYADPPWAYSQGGNTKSSHGIAKQHYPTMTAKSSEGGRPALCGQRSLISRRP